MSLRNYGVVKGRPLEHHRETDDDTPHYQIHLDAGDTSFRLPVNVKSSLEPSQLVYFETATFIHPVTDALFALSPGCRTSQAAAPSTTSAATCSTSRR